MASLKEKFSEFFNMFEDVEKIDAEKIKATLESSMKFSQLLQDKMVSGTEEEKKELQEFLQEMQAKIEEEKKKIFEKIGMSENELISYLENKENFTDEQWRAMQDMKKELMETVMPGGGEMLEKTQKVEKLKNKKLKTQWVQG